MRTLTLLRSGRLVAALLLGVLVASSQPASGTRGGNDQILNLNQRIRSLSGAAGLRALLEERARLLAELIELDPHAAADSALPGELLQSLARRVPDAASLLEETGEWTGPLSTTIADDFEHGRSRVVRVIQIEERAISVFWADPPSTGCSPSATIRGIRLGDRIAVTSGEVAPQAGAPCTTTGDQKTLVLLISYPSTPLPAGFTQSYVHDTFFGPAPSVTDFWRESSYGRTSASGSVFGPFTLDADYSCDQIDAILLATIRAADSAVDFTAYQRIFMILPRTASCTFSGYGTVGCRSQQSPSRGSFTASAAWVMTSPQGLLRVADHEGGHNFGLNHARSLDYDTVPLGPPGTDGAHVEYGDPFSAMGGNAGHFAAPQKNLLGWLPQGTNWQQVESSATYVLSPLSQPSGSLQALRIRRGSANNQWLWLEYRQPIGSYDSTLNSGAFAGALIHLDDPGQPSWAKYSELLDFKPTHAPNTFQNAALNAGSTWSDPYSDLTLVIGSATSSGLTVSASYGSPCATTSPSSRSHGPLGETGQISVSAPPGCSWTAIATANWITITGGQSGNGAGTVTYSLAANTESAARSAIIALARQNFTVTQAALPQAVSVTPASGTGASQTFAFLFTDSFAYANLTSAEVNINASQVSAGSCYVRWEAAGSLLYLRNDAGNAWLGPVPVGDSAGLQNAQCALAPGASSTSGSGVSLTLNLALSFKGGFAGAKNVYMLTQSAALATGWQQRGAWTVNAAPAMISVSPASGSGNTQVFTFTIANVSATTTGSVAFGPSSRIADACVLYYPGQGTSSIYLYNDAGNSGAWSELGSGPPVENSQCVLNGAGSSAVLNGSDLTLNVAITFKPTFAGPKNVYMSGSNNTLQTPSQLRGTWTVIAGPAVLSLTPGRGTGASLSFTGVFSDPAAYTNLSAADINVGGTLNGCWVHYTRATNSFALRNDADTAWLAPVNPGSSVVSSNTQCILAGSGSTATGSGTGLTVVLALSFRPGFAGVRTVSAQTSSATSSTGWQPWGSWTVNAAPTMIGVSPGGAAGSSQVFTFSFGNVTNATWLYVIFGAGTSSTSNSCALSFPPQSSGFFLASDNGASNYYAFNSSTPAQNSQCRINPAASSLVLTGSDATLTLAAAFQPAYSGLKNIYMRGDSNLFTPYLLRGTYLANLALLPVLSIAKTHAGNFTQGQQNATYTVTVSNQAAAAPTGGTVTVTETVPLGMTLVSMNGGATWNCTLLPACTTSSLLNGGFGYPPITATVNVASNAASLVINQVTVSGGGSAGASATDPTTVNCAVSVSPTSPAVAPTAGALTLTIGGGSCGWTAVSNVSWLTPAVASGTSATLIVTVAANATGAQRSGTLTFGGQTVTVTQPASGASQGPPALVSLSPFQGTGPNATLTLVYSHPNGWAAIKSAEFIMNPRWEPGARGGGCYVKYAPGTGLFTLIADDGTSVAGTSAPGTGSNLSNSQCTLNAASSSVTGSGNTLTVVASLTFTPSFSGMRHIWMQAVEANNLSSNWLVYGAWFPTQTTVNTFAFYRIYDPNSKSYLNGDLNEYNYLGTQGFTQLGLAGQIMDGPGSVGGVSNIAWYRLYVNANGSHFYTSDRNEFLYWNNQPQVMVGEGVSGFMVPYLKADGTYNLTPPTNMVAFYRAGQGTDLHYWTADADEFFGRNGKHMPSGYIGEGIASWVFPASGAVLNDAASIPESTPAPVDTDDGGPAVVGALNAASRASSGVIAPGQALSVVGRHLGGRVLLNGVAAQVISATDNEIRIVVPKDLTGEVSLQVEHRGRRTKAAKLDVVPANPAIFGSNAFGRGNAQARNEDGTMNGAEHAAARGSVVTLYTTGFTAGTELPVEVHIAGRPADVLATRESATRAGVIEVRVRVPETVAAGAFQPVVLHVGNQFSQPGVGLAIQ